VYAVRVHGQGQGRLHPRQRPPTFATLAQSKKVTRLVI
jgi:hypothetical protein